MQYSWSFQKKGVFIGSELICHHWRIKIIHFISKILINNILHNDKTLIKMHPPKSLFIGRNHQLEASLPTPYDDGGLLMLPQWLCTLGCKWNLSSDSSAFNLLGNTGKMQSPYTSYKSLKQYLWKMFIKSYSVWLTFVG